MNKTILKARLRGAAFALGCALLPLYGVAASSASGTAEFTITLHDLSPDDGFAPSLTFIEQGAWWPRLYSTAASNDSQFVDITVFTSTSHLQSGSSSANTSDVSSTTEFLVSNGGITFALSSRGHWAGGTPSAAKELFWNTASFGADSTGSYDGLRTGAVSISPNTRVSISVITATEVESNSGVGVAAYAGVGFNSGNQSTGQNFWVETCSQFQIQLCGLANASDDALSENIEIYNFTGDPLEGILRGYVISQAYYSGNTIHAIPEPETYALMLVGLAVVGAAARRRKAK